MAKTKVKPGNYLKPEDRAAMAREAEAEKNRKRQEARRQRINGVAGLVVSNGALLTMIHLGLIHDFIGMLFLVMASVFFGRMTK